ncbi:protein PYRICULARIA ORYZAE RESISTANCE 21-like isoform X2 [Tripterygium wilfordii]|uniref:protein PYRICULARIA ORYZAE RESISTANCE 21-like isoform X1 n=1 Tax=Tripterygium wilfordii TaxID=458696 RepID=UPI0018F7F844|nr:protein PYRICULARIA ORYZAE RESISTANCE 21-like isoform X1 [Tripterygium wilfordii]XP_038691979.1 protein PYRICULARIA ORYZAE RESISTANCE 21-like isoform X2 [Tripterygium wilfordii]
MAEPNVTTMVIKVDLQCEKCYKKIKKVLCKFPEIRDQVYDEKKNTVTIKVVGCSPEKIKKKICCKGGNSVKDIEIVPEKKKKEPEKPKQPEKPKEPEKKPQPCSCNPPPVAGLPIGVCCPGCCGGRGCWRCYHGYGYGYPPRFYEGCYGTPVYDSWCGGCYH